jgi:hypothetical protein
MEHGKSNSSHEIYPYPKDIIHGSPAVTMGDGEVDRA